ncbi:hypothetical protein cypCar_00035178, partial [Cyprinus carpio]
RISSKDSPRTENAVIGGCTSALDSVVCTAPSVSMDAWNARVLAAVTVIGFIQFVSTVTLLLHFTGHITQIDSVTALKNHSEAVIKESILSERLTHDEEKKRRRSSPAAHLPIRPSRQTQSKHRSNL